MNAPTHIAASACIAEALLLAGRGTMKKPEFRIPALLAIVLLSALLSVGAHFLLDWLPHRSWTVFSYNFVPSLVRFDQFLRAALLGSVAIIPCLYWCRRYWYILVPVMIVGVYPDIEKIAFFDGILSEDLLVFRSYSTHWSEPDTSMAAPLLALYELAVLGCLIFFAWIMSRSLAHNEPRPEE